MYNRNHKEFGHREFGTREVGMPLRNHLNRAHYGFDSYTRPVYEYGQNQFDIPCADILELDDQFVLELALPGVVLDDIELKIEGRYLTVIAKRTPTMFEEKAMYLRRELPSTLMVREFEFETEILWENVEARLDRGLLFISLPKLEAALRIPVSHGSIEGHVSSTKTRTLKTEVRSGKEITIK